MNKTISSAIALFLSCGALFADNVFDRAKTLYDSKLYAQAMSLFQSHPQFGKDAMVDGYVVLCAQKQHTPGYESMVEGYYKNYSSCSLCIEVRKENAYDLFDQGQYRKALDLLQELRLSDFDKKSRPEFIFKKGYCYYKLDNLDAALSEFDDVDNLMINDYSAPAQYVSGYIHYGRGAFAKALSYFEKSVRDERFEAISNYYIINCHFEQDDYDFVVNKGVELYENAKTPTERKSHLARIISESYLVKGNKAQARRFYDMAQDDTQKNRADYFYAGSLMYATQEYQAAVDNFSKMSEKSDSLGQIAWYESAFSYMGLKNKVAALDAFKNASQLSYDKKIKEDAYFNYAKLAFDLNGDTSIFAKYISTYSDKVRGELIYSYMALTALADKDYQAAIDAYDKIDVLEGQEKNNYVNANYLRGAELLEHGSYRKSIPCFKAVTYYAPKGSSVHQLAGYALAEAYYRNFQYSDAVAQYTALYNNSALYGTPEGKSIAYNLAYSCLKAEDYTSAQRWFRTYVNDGGGEYSKDATLRIADCSYAVREYKDAVEAYQQYLDSYFDVNDIYPYYQAALCCGLSVEQKSSARKQNEKYKARKIEFLSRARGADPGAAYYNEAMLELGRSLHAEKKNTEALAVFREIVANAKDTLSAAHATLEIGTLKRNVKDMNGALTAYKTVVERYSSTGLAEDALLAIESIYQSMNSPQQYLAYLETIGRGSSKTEQEKEAMYYSAAEQLFFSDDYARAIVSFNEFIQTYPQSEKVAAAYFYIGESYRLGLDKEQACDAYEKVFGMPDGAYTENALKQYASLNFSMENYGNAYKAYDRVGDALGAMRSAYKGKQYDAAIAKADAVLASQMTELVKGEAGMTKAKSLLSTSRREEAYALLASLAENPKTEVGAEAAYMIIVDCYDRADFDAVKEKVYALADSGTSHQNFLAKAFVVLGDSFVEQGRPKQAEATFKSVAEGYKDDKELNAEIKLRLEKLSENK